MVKFGVVISIESGIIQQKKMKTNQPVRTPLRWRKGISTRKKEDKKMLFTNEKKFNFDGYDGVHDLRKDKRTWSLGQTKGWSLFV